MKRILKILRQNRGHFLGQTKTRSGKAHQFFKVGRKFYSIQVICSHPTWPIEDTLKEVAEVPTRLRGLDDP